MSSGYISQLTNDQGLNIQFRYYKPEDSEKVISLDTKNDNVHLLGGLIRGIKQYFTEYHHRLDKYKESFTILGEDISDNKNPVIVASVSLSIKDIFFSKTKVKAGIVTILRVDHAYRRLGIAHKIMSLIEEIAKQKGVQVLYLYAAANNDIAHSLYKKLGYSLSVIRQFNLSGINKKSKIEPTLKDNDLKLIRFKEIDLDETKANLDQAFSNEDLRPQDWDELYKLPEYVGSCIVESEDQSVKAGLSIFSEKREAVYEFTKFFLPAKFFLDTFYILLLYILSVLVTAGIYITLKYGLELTLFLSASIAGGIHISMILVYLKIAKLLKLMRGEKRARYIGQFYIGDKKYESRVMKFLVKNAEAMCNKNGFTSSIAFGDKFNLIEYFPCQVPIMTVIMHKIIDSALGSNETKDKLSEKAFYDFRDV